MRRPKQVYEIRPLPAHIRRIRDIRTDRDLTQQQVAILLHVSQRTYADYELGNIRIPVDIMISLAKHYGVDMNYICALSNIRHPFPVK